MFKENLPKNGPLFREFGAQKPTHMGGTYPYPQHVMYPLGLAIHSNPLKTCLRSGSVVFIKKKGCFFSVQGVSKKLFDV